MLELHKIIRLSCVVAWSLVFILFYERRWQGGALKVMKNDTFFSFFSRRVLFPKILGRLKGYLC